MTTPTTFYPDMEAAHGAAWVWLWEFTVRRATATVPAAVVRLARWHQEVLYPAGPSALTWSPFPFAHSEIVQSTDGSLPSVELTIDNTQRLVLPYLLGAGGVAGNEARALLLPQSHIGVVGRVAMEWPFVVQEVIVSDTAAVFRMGSPNWLDVRTPTQRYTAGSCRWEEFGGEECGYIRNVVAAVERCDRTLTTCRLVGADEAARGLPVLHPKRFGGFPGIPVQRSF